MLDNALIIAICNAVEAGLTGAGIPGIPVVQGYQPTDQGVPTTSTIFLYKIGDRRYGTVARNDYWDEDAEKEYHKEEQQYETLFQFSALSTQNPADSNSKTAADILNLVAAILQSDSTIATLQAQDIGILRVQDVRNTPFIDDRGRNEYNPSLDFMVTHKQVLINEIGVIDSREFQIVPI